MEKGRTVGSAIRIAASHEIPPSPANHPLSLPPPRQRGLALGAWHEPLPPRHEDAHGAPGETTRSHRFLHGPRWHPLPADPPRHSEESGARRRNRPGRSDRRRLPLAWITPGSLPPPPPLARRHTPSGAIRTPLSRLRLNKRSGKRPTAAPATSKFSSSPESSSEGRALWPPSNPSLHTRHSLFKKYPLSKCAARSHLQFDPQ